MIGSGRAGPGSRGRPGMWRSHGVGVDAGRVRDRRKMGALAESDFRSLLKRTSEDRFGQWRRYAWSLTHNDADADDVVQEAIANTLRLSPKLDSEMRVHYYVQRAIRNTALSLIDRRGRTVGLPEPEETPAGTSSVLEMLLDNEQQDARLRLSKIVEHKLGRLRGEQRELIENMVMRSPRMKLREMAKIQGVAAPTVHYRLGRALQKLLELVQEEMP